MTVEALMNHYLPMSRKLSYLLLALLEPCVREEICQTVSELSDGEFDDEPGFRMSIDTLVEELLDTGVLEYLPEEREQTITISGTGSKLLICEFNRMHWLEHSK